MKSFIEQPRPDFAPCLERIVIFVPHSASKFRAVRRDLNPLLAHRATLLHHERPLFSESLTGLMRCHMLGLSGILNVPLYYYPLFDQRFHAFLDRANFTPAGNPGGVVTGITPDHVRH